MVERLIQSLMLLAADADVQLARLREGPSPDAMALDFDDAFRLVNDCPQVLLEGRQRRRLDRLERFLAERSDAVGGAGFWREDAVHGNPAWQQLRLLAREALDSLGES